MKSLCLAILLMASCCVAAPAYYANARPDVLEGWKLALPAPSANQLYRDSRCAIELLSLVCDGRKLEPENCPGGASPPYKFTTVGRPGVVIYQFMIDWLESWVDVNASTLEAMRHKYTVPRVFQRLDVSYRVRYPDGRVSELQSVTVLRSDQAEFKLSLP